jgi:hypothetical protein
LFRNRSDDTGETKKDTCCMNQKTKQKKSGQKNTATNRRMLAQTFVGVLVVVGGVALSERPTNHSGRMAFICQTRASGTDSPHCETALIDMPNRRASAVEEPASLIAFFVSMPQFSILNENWKPSKLLAGLISTWN